jgi:predicted phage terminase large subunit-like protein
MAALADIDAVELLMLQDELCRRSLADHVQACYPAFSLSPWQQHLCRRLQAFVESIERGESPRLMVHIMPQAGKTTIVSRAFIAWIMGRHPEWDGIMASYASSLSRKNSRWVRNRLRSPEHQRIFPGCKLADDSQAIEDMTMTDGHQLISRGVGGGSSGNPANYVVIDDPFSNRQDASSPVVQENVEDWYDGTAVGRLGPGAGVLIMHTRWDIMDLAGRLLKRSEDGKDDPHIDKWEVISYPAEWEPGAPREFYAFEKGANGAETGWLISRFRPVDLKRKKANLPPRDWLSLFQQKPVQEGGNIIKTSWIIEEPWPEGWRPIVWQAWDLAGTKQDAHDGGCYSVGVAIAQDWMRRWWLVDVVRGKWDSGELCEQILTFAHKWKANAVWGEDPVALYLVPFLRDRMRDSGKHAHFSRVSVQGRGDKVARAQASLVPVMSNGSFYVPKGAAWLNDLKVELGQFPQGYKDQVDALSLAFAEAMPRAVASPPPPIHKPKDPTAIRWDDLGGDEPPERRRSAWKR